MNIFHTSSGSHTNPHRSRVRQALCGVWMVVCLSGSVLGSDTQNVEAFLEPYKSIDVAATDSGIVEKMEVLEGQDIASGAPIARLDQDIHKAALEIARKAMDSQGQTKAAQAELTVTTNRYKKLLSLRDRDHATAEEVSRAELEQALAEAKLLVARETQEIRAAEYERYRIQLERRTVRSPVSGVVIRVHRDQGEFINPSDPTVATIVQLDPLLATFSVPESKVKAIAATNDVKLQIAGSTRIAAAEIEFVSPVISPQTATVSVKVKIPNPEGKFRAGERCYLLLGDTPLTRVAPAAATPKSPAPVPFAPAAASSARQVSDEYIKAKPPTSTKPTTSAIAETAPAATKSPDATGASDKR